MSALDARSASGFSLVPDARSASGFSLVAHRSAILGRRACAALAACSAALHAGLLGHAANPVIEMVMVAMIVACLYCARDLWRHGTLRAWCVVALMNLAMIALHLPAPGQHHHDGQATVAAVGNPSAVMTLATALALVEALAAAAVLCVRTRGRLGEVVLAPPR